MKALILVAVTLHLVITIRESNGKYQFGDILVFPRKCIGTTKPLYKHYAIYVGPKSGIDIGQGDNDIFHRTGTLLDKTNCRFGKLEKTEKSSNVHTDNYLDGIEGFKPGTKEEITARIKDIIEHCDKYQLFTNNCEHLATRVRYDMNLSLQHGAIGACMVPKKLKSKKLKQIRERIKQDKQDEKDCQPKI